mmetsp:Transcript_68550/g.149157  ORF Transcript_68550/g.149157 Transcript_68550/m.149157 type:complete len:323 (+) Transcript_68550:611-1579(+)
MKDDSGLWRSRPLIPLDLGRVLVQDVKHIINEQPPVAGISDVVGSRVETRASIRANVLGSTPVKMTVLAKKVQCHDGQGRAAHAHIDLDGVMLVGAVGLPHRDEIHCCIAKHALRCQLLANALRLSNEICRIVKVSRKVASHVDLPVEPLFMRGENLRFAAGPDEELDRWRGLSLTRTLNEDLADTSELLQLRAVMPPVLAARYVVQLRPDSFLQGTQGCGAILVHNLRPKLVVEPKDGITLAAEGLIKFDHDLPGIRIALQDCQYLGGQTLIIVDCVIAAVWVEHSCAAEDLPVARLGAPMQVLVAVTDDGHIDGSRQLHL